MKAIVAKLTLIALLTITNTTFAEQVTWLGVGASNWTLSPDNYDRFSSTALNLRAGIHYSDNFGVETHLATGGKDTVRDIEAKLNLMWGVFLRGAYPIKNFRLYGLFGAANLNMSADATIDGEQVNGSDRVTRLSYGAGAEYLFDNKWGFNLDYMVYATSNNFDFSATSVGFVYRFE